MVVVQAGLAPVPRAGALPAVVLQVADNRKRDLKVVVPVVRAVVLVVRVDGQASTSTTCSNASQSFQPLMLRWATPSSFPVRRVSILPG